MKTGVLNMPRLGETMEEGQIATWLIEVGDKFSRGQAIIEIETDKTIVEYPALGAGTLEEKMVSEGDIVPVGAPIAKIGFEGKADWITKADPAKEKLNLPDLGKVEDQGKEPKSAKTKGSGELIRATPAARRLAKRENIYLRDIYGTGRRGRIETTDVAGVKKKDGASIAHEKIQFSHDIAYTETGPADGVRFLLIHGFSGDSSFSGLSNQLGRKGVRCVAINMPGHGATRLEAQTLNDLSTNLVQFSSQIMGPSGFHLVAHSIGAIPAVELATKIKPASLTLIAPAGIGTGIDTEFVHAMSAPTSIGQVSHLLRRLSVQPVKLSEAALKAVYTELARQRLINLANDFIGENGQSVDIVAKLERLSKEMPVRVIIGHQDQVIDWQDVLALPATIAIHHFKQSGHMPHWDQQRELCDLLTGSLKNE